MNDSLKFSILIVVGLVSFAAFLFLSMREDNIERFVAVAEEYSVAYAKYEPVIHTPGSGSNRARRGVASLLNIVLMGDIENEQRIALSEQALGLVDVLDQQVDEITSKNQDILTHGAEVKAMSKQVHGYGASQHAEDIALLVDKRLLYIEEVADLLSQMNVQTRTVFERVIDDGGTMSDEHIMELNSQLSQAEEQYDRLSFIYTELANGNDDFENHFFEIRVLKNK